MTLAPAGADSGFSGHSGLRRAVEAKVGRMRAGPAKARQRLAEAAKTQADWWGLCRKCGTRIEGTIASLKEHTCGEPSQ